jgi:hypothetical protein
MLPTCIGLGEPSNVQLKRRKTVQIIPKDFITD